MPCEKQRKAIQDISLRQKANNFPIDHRFLRERESEREESMLHFFTNQLRLWLSIKYISRLRDPRALS